jgi:peroxiredoxin
MKKHMVLLPLMLMCALVASGCREAPRIKKGDRLPSITLDDIDGGNVIVPDELGGQVNVLLFWHEGCQYCKEGMPATEGLYRKYAGKGFEFVAIQVGGSRETSVELVREHGLTFPMLYDRESVVLKEYGIFGTPTMFFADGQGILKEKILGDLDARTLEEMVLEKLR